METINSEIYRQAFIKYLRKGTPIHLTLKNKDHPNTHYIWRANKDGKVRATHAANDGKIFSWNEPPATGHPGEDYNCRCHAEPYLKGKTEFAYQTLVEPIADSKFKWDTEEFLDHFWYGGGKAVKLSDTGHLRGVISHYAYTLGRFEAVNQQIIDAARKNGQGELSHDFHSSYKFGKYLYLLGGGTVNGFFTGKVNYSKDFILIKGRVNYYYTDIFTDPISIREALRRSSKPKDIDFWKVYFSDLRGTYYDIFDFWQTEYTAEVKLDEASSIYKEYKSQKVE